MSKLTIYTGDTFVGDFAIVDVDGNAQDITGATVTFTAHDYTGADLFTTSTTSHTTPASGLTQLTLSKTTTASLALGNFPYDLEVVLASGTRYTALRDRVEILPEMTDN